MRQDQIEAIQFMLDDYGVEGLLNAVADALERKAQLVHTHATTQYERYTLQAEALRAQAAALAAGRALTYTTQTPLEALARQTIAAIRSKRFK